MQLLLGLLIFATVSSIYASPNPFLGRTYFVSPAYQKEINTSIATATGQTKANLQKMYHVPSAYWIDVMAKITGPGTDNVEWILREASLRSPPPLVVFIVYDLPNRDCHAFASNGEICCTPKSDGTCDYSAAGECAGGLQVYQKKYIDPLVTLFRKYSMVPIVAVIEPDSLGNLATNMGDPRCANSATQTAYKQGIQYAITQIATARNVVMYLDACHGGWLGWTNNAQKYISIVQDLQVTQYLRGFTTNVANYEPLGVQCPQVGWCLNNMHQGDPCCADPCRLETQWNPANNELNFAMELQNAFMQSVPGFTPTFVIDTGRNGVVDMRENCANWCNIRGAGAGLIPTTNTANTTLIDAYFWLKPPGESDGCTQTLPDGSQCPRFDQSCASVDSIGSRNGEPRAPQAGKWFDYQVKQLASNARF
jgi:cellulose 1,4-beta-cellobiosidase